MLCGFVLRWAGMWTLRGYFSANVAVQSDHRLVIRGPYRRVRHPGYCGGWIAFCGLAFALANGIGLALLVLGTLPAFFCRMAVEERALVAAFPGLCGLRAARAPLRRILNRANATRATLSICAALVRHRSGRPRFAVDLRRGIDPMPHATVPHPRCFVPAIAGARR